MASVFGISMMSKESSFDYVVFAAKPKDVVRLVLDYEASLRPILWLSTGRDGSIYFALERSNSRTNPSLLYSRKLTPTEGVTTFNYMDLGSPCASDEETIRRFKHSVHASGIVNTMGGRILRESLRQLDGPQFIAHLLFRHPEKYQSIETPRRADLCHKYPIDEQRPLRAQLFISPIAMASPIAVKVYKHQINIGLQYEGFSGADGYVLQLVIGHSDVNTWPPVSWVLFPVTKPSRPS